METAELPTQTRKITPSSYMRGYRMHKNDHVNLESAGFIKVRSERNPDQEPYVMRVRDDESVPEHFCGYMAMHKNSLCKHIIAYQFEKFSESMVHPHERIVEIFGLYEKCGMADKLFDKDLELYELKDLVDPELADSLLLSLFTRLLIEYEEKNKFSSINKSVLGKTYEELIKTDRFLTAKFKSLEDKNHPIYRVLNNFITTPNRRLSDVIMECEADGIVNAKNIVHRAYKEDLLFPKRLGKVYVEAFKQYLDLNKIF